MLLPLIKDFKHWKEKSHAKYWQLFPENIEKRLSIDEVALSKGKAGSIISKISDTKGEYMNVVDKIDYLKPQI